jgi:hypothetical protein
MLESGGNDEETRTENNKIKQKKIRLFFGFGTELRSMGREVEDEHKRGKTRHTYRWNRCYYLAHLQFIQNRCFSRRIESQHEKPSFLPTKYRSKDISHEFEKGEWSS